MSTPLKGEIHDYIVNTWLSGDARGFDDDTDLQTAGVLDSFSMLDLMTFLDSTFHVRIEPADVTAESFKSVNAIADLVQKKLPPAKQ
jgi:acyl carrier protein